MLFFHVTLDIYILSFMGKFFLTFKFQKERAINYFLQNQGTKILTSSIDSLNKGEKN